jgi:hypothetical protein
MTSLPVSERGVGQRSHQAHLRSAVNQAQAGFSQQAAQSHSLGKVLRTNPGLDPQKTQTLRRDCSSILCISELQHNLRNSRTIHW